MKTVGKQKAKNQQTKTKFPRVSEIKTKHRKEKKIKMEEYKLPGEKMGEDWSALQDFDPKEQELVDKNQDFDDLKDVKEKHLKPILQPKTIGERVLRLFN